MRAWFAGSTSLCRMETLIIRVSLALELQPHPGPGIEDAPTPRGQMAVDEGRGNAGAEGVALERRPAAFGQDLVAAHGMRHVGIDQYQVGEIAFAQEAAVPD